MSEFLIIQVGQCGNQIGGALWPAILSEYNVISNDLENTRVSKNYKDAASGCLNSFFDSISSERRELGSCSNLRDLEMRNIKARVICVDMEDSVVSRFSNSDIKFLFDKRSLITNYPGSANNWAEGYYTHGIKYRDKIFRAITRYVEKCHSLHGVLMIYSMGGGTGSGLGSYILEKLEDYYPNIERFVACVYPTGSGDVITAPFNAMLATQHLIRHATCVFPVDNGALQEICDRKHVKMNNHFRSIGSTFQDMNSLVVKLLLHVTSGSRFSGQLNFDINEINTNMVPFPNLKFLASSFSPVGVNDRCDISSSATRENNFWNTCKKNNQLLAIDPMDENSSLLAGMLFGRGDYNLTDMRNYVHKIQKKAPFTEWSKKCIKVGLCSIPPIDSDFSMMALFNTTSIIKLFNDFSVQYNKLLERKAHIHHYVGVKDFELDYFYECQNTIDDLIDLYKEIKTSVPDKLPRLRPNINY